jgi:ATP-dependent Clp protease ATP-binding subunit ClpA
MFERFTVPSREVVVRAMGEAQALGHAEIGTGHLLLALLDERAGPASAVLRDAGLDHATARAELARRMAEEPLLGPADAEALKSVGIDLDAVLTRITESFGADALRSGTPPARRGGPRLDKAGKAALAQALHEAVARHDRRIDAEHLLLGVLGQAHGMAVALLTAAGADPEQVRARTLAALDQAA